MKLLFLAILFTTLALACSGVNAESAAARQASSFIQSAQSKHTNNWAVIVCTSRFWFNYRHVANALSLYRTVRRLGIPDSRIILMLADDIPCDAHNSEPARMFASEGRWLDVYGDDIEVDYRSYEVNVENFIRVMTGRVDDGVPASKKLLSDSQSNVLVYMTGHGGDEFLKFQDAEEITTVDLRDVFDQMFRQKRYNELLFIADTCQAGTLTTGFRAPNVIGVGSSIKGEDSLSYTVDTNLGVAVVDRFTHFMLSYLETIEITSNATMQDMMNYLTREKVQSTPYVRSDLISRPLSEVKLTEFFASLPSAVVGVPSLPTSAVEEMLRSHTEEGSGSAGQNTKARKEKKECDSLRFRQDGLKPLK